MRRMKLAPVPLKELNGRLTACWERLETQSPNYEQWSGYTEFCMFIELPDEYRRAREALLDRFGAAQDPSVAERVARACLLLPPTDEEMRKATALIGRALAHKRPKSSAISPNLIFIKGLADYRQGRLDDSMSIMEGPARSALDPAPRLVLAMAQHKLGQEDKALATLAAAVLAIDWRVSEARDPEMWMFHALRREAEAMIVPNLPDFVRGTYRPRKQNERLALLGVCQFKELHHAAACIYLEAFAADPSLTFDPQSLNVYQAACYASLTGSGKGADVAGLVESQRRQWRRQAREWLRADLTTMSKYAIESEPKQREFVQKMLKQWQEDPDLSGLRRGRHAGEVLSRGTGRVAGFLEPGQETPGSNDWPLRTRPALIH